MLSRFLFSSLLLIAIVCVSEAKTPKRKIPSPRVQAALVINVDSKKVLHAKNSKIPVLPASLAKLMTVYLAFEALEIGKISLNDQIIASQHVADAKPCKLGLELGQAISVKDAILAAIVRSANDATRAVAERIAGNEQKFTNLMNKKAKQLGMKNTHFMNSTGWHHERNKTTAEDLAKLALALKKKFPKYYHFFAQTSFDFQGKTYLGTNRVTRNYPGAEGFKTGYTIPSGFNLISIANKNNKNLLAILIGEPSARVRDDKMMSLLDKHFASKHSKDVLVKDINKRNPTPLKKINKITAQNTKSSIKSQINNISQVKKS